MSDTNWMMGSSGPLANRMRPSSLAELVGQSHLLEAGSPLHLLAASDGQGHGRTPASVVLYGPPGCGKTTIAMTIARTSGRKFIQLSALTSGVKDVRDVADRARIDHETYGVTTILFIDEIHRFSKTQQDSLLPSIEGGWVTLIAATTENPGYSLVTPLLSRSLVLQLKPIDANDIESLLDRAMESPDGLQGAVSCSPDVKRKIAKLASGDARRALTILDAAAQVSSARTAKKGSKPKIEAEDVEKAADVALVHYDRAGDQHYDVISAFIKSIRGSDADAAIHYLARMIEAGEDPRFIARRLVISAAEDVGLADPGALQVAVAASEAAAKIGMPEARIPLAEATIYLALAPKSNAAYLAINEAMEDVRAGLSAPVPAILQNNPAVKSKAKYVYPHDHKAAVVKQAYVDGEIGSRTYFRPKLVGFERELAERWARIRAIVRGK